MTRRGGVSARRVEPHDVEVGRRIRIRRLERQMSQTELATRLGVTFQQVQKYEKGLNRVGAGRLMRVAEALEVPVSFFFLEEGHSAPEQPSVMNFLDTAYSVRLVQAFARINERSVQRAIVDLVERLSEQE
ncbi:MAG: helix-turn-helix domain-containing protein [Variibacter sp.]